jgi:hypothetical protein
MAHRLPLVMWERIGVLEAGERATREVFFGFHDAIDVVSARSPRVLKGLRKACCSRMTSLEHSRSPSKSEREHGMRGNAMMVVGRRESHAM